MPACPYCGKENQPSSAFCIDCGEPTDEESVSKFAAGLWRPESLSGSAASGAPPPTPGRHALGAFLILHRGLEFLVGVALIAVIAGYALLTTAQQEIQARHYRAGIDASNAHSYDQALAEFKAAGVFLDSGIRLRGVQDLLKERDSLYRQAVHARDTGDWWQAAHLSAQVTGIGGPYLDSQAILTSARSVNGMIAYRPAPGAPAVGAIYLSYSDGGDARPIPGTDSLSQVEAISPDARFLVYSVYRQEGGRSLFLYEIAEGVRSEIVLPWQPSPSDLSVRFSVDSTRVWVGLGGSVIVYKTPTPGGSGAPLMPDSGWNPLALQLQHDIVLIVTQDLSHETSKLVVGDFGGSRLRTVADEKGLVDGALFSGDGRYLLYRLCTGRGPMGTYLCALKLVDVDAAELQPLEIAAVPVQMKDSQRWALNGEFTRDDRHLVVLERYEGDDEAHVYDLVTGDVRRLEDQTRGNVSSKLIEGPLVGNGVPGLQFWHGLNSIAYTWDTSVLPEGQGDWPARFYARSHWVLVSPTIPRALYLAGTDVKPGAGDYLLYSARLAVPSELQGQTSPLLLIHATRNPAEWLPMTYMLPDGRTLLSAAPPTPGAAPGIYAYSLDTGDSTVAVPGATELWYPGFSSLLPTIPGDDGH